MTIVTTRYRYRRPPGKRKVVALEVPAVVRAADRKRRTGAAALGEQTTPAAFDRPSANGDRRSAPVRSEPAIVTIRRAPAKLLSPGLLPETPEEHKRRGDAADAMFREIVRRSTRGSVMPSVGLAHRADHQPMLRPAPIRRR